MKKIFLISFLIISLMLWARYSWASDDGQRLISPAVRGLKTANLWFPQKMTPQDQETTQISAKAAYFVDLKSGQILYQKNPHLRLPIASLVKIMTAIISLENRSPEAEVEINSKAAGMEPDSMLLKTDEKLTVEELLDGMFLVSANDAAEALAETSLGSREEFIAKMNEKARQLGMNDTLFINPTGLEEDSKKQYSTAYDVILMSRYAIKYFPKLVEITSTLHLVLPETDKHQSYDLYSGINLLTTYPGVLGFKTGYTPEAGLTLVTLAKKEGQEVLGVILGSGDRRGEARELLDFSFQKLGRQE